MVHPRKVFIVVALLAASFVCAPAEFTDVTDWVQIGGEVLAKIFNTWEVVSPDGPQDGPGEYRGPEVCKSAKNCTFFIFLFKHYINLTVV